MLAGSRKQEIHNNLGIMVEVSRKFPEYQFVIAGAPGISVDFYKRYLDNNINIVFSQTYRLLQHSSAAMVTSGTATLETALFDVPQVVCYYMSAGKIVSLLRKCFLKVKYISLVNLITGVETVKELVANDMTVNNLQTELKEILPGGRKRNDILKGYSDLKTILGPDGASDKAASVIVDTISNNR